MRFIDLGIISICAEKIVSFGPDPTDSMNLLFTVEGRDQDIGVRFDSEDELDKAYEEVLDELEGKGVDTDTRLGETD